MIKRVFLLTLAVMFLLSTSVFASLDEKITGDNIEIKGKFSAENADSIITIRVIKPGAGLSGLNASDTATILSRIEYAGQVKADETGAFTFNIVQDENSGRYTYTVVSANTGHSENGAYYYSSEKDLADTTKAISDILKSTEAVAEKAKKLKALLTTNADMLNLNQQFPIYAEVTAKKMNLDSAYSRLASFDDLGDASSLVNNYQQSILLSALEVKDNDIAGKIIADYADLLEANKGIVMKRYNDGGFKASVCADVSGKTYPTVADYNIALNDSVFVQSINNVGIWGDIGIVLEDMAQLVNVSTVKFYQKSKTQQDEIMQKLSKTRSYPNKDAFVTALSSAVDAYDVIKTPSNPSGGSSYVNNSGSGTGGYSLQNITITPQAEPFYADDGGNNVSSIFNDLGSASWSVEAVEGLYNKGIENGMGDGTFLPNKSVTREEFVKMLVLSLGLTLTDEAADFDDVDAAHWASPYIATAKKHGIIEGTGDNMFGLTDAITRQDVSVMMVRGAEQNGKTFSDDNQEQFMDDELIASYAKDAVYKLKQSAVINGVDQYNFAPQDICTRAQAAKMVYGLTLIL